MKTPIFLFCFLCVFALITQAQELQRHPMPERGSQRIDDYIKPIQSGLKISMPLKRNLFSSSSYELKWDTMICYHDSSPSIISQRVSRTYNFFGEPLIQLTEQLPQGSANWVNFARETFTYDSTGNWLTYLSEGWQNNTWVNHQKQEFTFNTNGDLTDWKNIFWISNAWSNYWNYFYHYNSNGLNDTAIYQSGSQDTLWVNSQLWVVTYDTNSSMTSEIVSTWVNNGWMLNASYIYTNDSDGNHLTLMQQNWVNNSWVNNTYTTFTPYGAGNYLSALSQQWQNNSWVNTEYDSYTYDSAGNNTLWLVQNWANGSWVNSGQSLYVYDNIHDMLSETFQSWNNTSWRNQNMQQYTYDIWGNSMTGKYFMWGGNGWHPYDGGLYVFADHQRDNQLTFQNIYEYSAIIDSIVLFVGPVKSQFQVTLFPNPSHTMVYVYSALTSTDPNGSITMYDLRGQIVLSKPFIKEKTGMDISDLKPGVYFVKITSNRLTRVLKFIKD